MEGSSSPVKVFVRVRPQSTIEAGHGGTVNEALVVRSDAAEVVLNDVAGSDRRFTFDGVFGPDTTQQRVFEAIGRPTVERVLAGFNGTILAYGQTSSGKTHTMMGPGGGGAAEALREGERGLVPRILDELMDALTKLPAAEVVWKVSISVFELYNENLFDLGLASGEEGRGELRIREDRASGRGVYVDNLCSTYVTTAEEALNVVVRAAERKHMGGTNANETSSRSHSIVQLQVDQVNNIDGGTRTTAQLFLVDLAGSERVEKTGAAGQRLKEAQTINLSLTLLGNVINKLTDGKSLHIPYRDSKLTRLLQDSLGGNAMTSLLCTCSTSTFNAAETLSTLQFASRAKRIENKPHANKTLSDDELRRAYNSALERIRMLEETVVAQRKLATVTAADGSSSDRRGPTAAMGAGFRGATELLLSQDRPAETNIGVVELKDALESMMTELAQSREENQRLEEQLSQTQATVVLYRTREAELTAQLSQWKAQYEREKCACDSWAAKFQQLFVKGQTKGLPQPPLASVATKAPRTTGSTTKNNSSNSSSSKNSVSTKVTASRKSQVTSSGAAESEPDTSPTENTDGSVGDSAEEREMRALVRERMLLAQVDELRGKVNESLKYPIIIERLNKELDLLREDHARAFEKQAAEHEQLLKRQDAEIADLQMKLDARAALQDRDSTVGEEVRRLRAENEILHEENRANARRLIEFVTKAETLQQELTAAVAERDRLRRDIESSNMADELKIQLLGQKLVQQRSLFRRRLLECFSRSDE